MKATLTDLFTSKKFLAALTAVVVYAAGRFGFDVDPATLDRIFAALLVYVGAQGVADNGKSAAQILAAPAARAAAPIAPSASVSIALLALVVGGGVAFAACHPGPRLKAVEVAAWDCTLPERVELVAAFQPVADSALHLAIDPSGQVDVAKLRQTFSKANLLSDAGALAVCALSNAIAALLSQPAVVARSSSSEGPAPKPAPSSVTLRAAFEAIRSAQFTGVPIKTVGGTVL